MASLSECGVVAAVEGRHVEVVACGSWNPRPVSEHTPNVERATSLTYMLTATPCTVTRLMSGAPKVRSTAMSTTTHADFEGKAGASHSERRMAIGQLADYSRSLTDEPACAELLDTRPSKALHDLLRSQGIAAIWRTPAGFVDDSGGTFTLRRVR